MAYSKPSFCRLNQSSIYSQDIIDFVPLHEGSGKPTEVSNQSTVQGTFTGSPVWSNSVFGYGLSGSTPSVLTNFADTVAYGGSSWSIQIVFNVVSLGANYNCLFDRSTGPSGKDITCFMDASGNISYMDIGGGAAVAGMGANNGFVPTGFVVGGTYIFTITYDLPSNSIKFYVNGVFIKSSTISGSNTAVSSAVLHIGGNNTGGGSASSFIYYQFVGWKKALSASMVSKLAEDPFVMCRPRPLILKSSGVAPFNPAIASFFPFF